MGVGSILDLFVFGRVDSYHGLEARGTSIGTTNIHELTRIDVGQFCLICVYSCTFVVELVFGCGDGSELPWGKRRQAFALHIADAGTASLPAWRVWYYLIWS